MIAAAAALLLIATGYSAQAPATAQAGSTESTLRLGLSGDMTTLDPSTVYQYEGNQVLTAIYEDLLSYAGDSSSTMEPILAASYTISPGGLRCSFALRRDVLFADGNTMTSSDVQKSFKRLEKPDVASQMAYMLADVASYGTPDPATFVVTLNAPNTSFITLIASPFGAKVIGVRLTPVPLTRSSTAACRSLRCACSSGPTRSRAGSGRG